MFNVFEIIAAVRNSELELVSSWTLPDDQHIEIATYCDIVQPASFTHTHFGAQLVLTTKFAVEKYKVIINMFKGKY